MIRQRRTPLVVVLSARTAEHVRTVAEAGWDGPVLLVGSVGEAQQVLQARPSTGRQETAPDALEREPRRAAQESQLHDSAAAPGEAPALRLDVDRQRVVCGAAAQRLTPLEFGVLEALLRAPGRVHRFAELTRSVWGTHYTGDAASLHAVVRRLRRKLHDVHAPLELEAVRGIGFRLGQSDSSQAEARGPRGLAAGS